MKNDKLYIFLTLSTKNIGGGQIYVYNKLKYFEALGWNVIVFQTNKFDKCIFKEKKMSEAYTFEELRYPPIYTNKRNRDIITNSIVSIIQSHITPNTGKIVLESTTPNCALWGEHIATIIRCKHIVYLLGESLRCAGYFDFFNFKLKRQELASIHKESLKKMFFPYRSISDEENVYINAGCFSLMMPSNIDCDQLDNFPIADYTIGYYGRIEKVHYNLWQDIISFAHNNSEKKINLIVLGCSNKQDEEKLKSFIMENPFVTQNLFIRILPSILPTPQKFFDICDVILSSAGCADIAFLQKKIVISINVESSMPIGVLGNTTFESTFSNQETKLNDLLTEILLQHKYTVTDDLIIKFNNIRKYDKAKEQFIDFAIGNNVSLDYFPISGNILLETKPLKGIICRIFGIRNLERLIYIYHKYLHF